MTPGASCMPCLWAEQALSARKAQFQSTQVVAVGSQGNMVGNYKVQEDMSGMPTESARGAINSWSSIQSFEGTNHF